MKPRALAPALLAVCALPAAGEPLSAGAVVQGFDGRGAPFTLRVDAARIAPEDKDGDLTLYTFSLADGAGGWAPYCAADPWGGREAVVLQGSWDLGTGAKLSAEGTTIACLDGAIGKCVRFGYKPWKTVGGRSLADHHAACVRMLRADYCGDGRPHTKDGTFIHLYDAIGVQEPGPDRPVELEAGWGPDGATWISVPRWGDDAAAIAAECPEKLAGRVAAAGERPAGAEVLARVPGTLIVSERAALPEDRMRKPPMGAQAR